jgi:hypothetical protein
MRVGDEEVVGHKSVKNSTELILYGDDGADFRVIVAILAEGLFPRATEHLRVAAPQLILF